MIFCKIYFFAVTAALFAPLLLHIPRQQDHQRWGKNFFGHFFLGQEIGSEFFPSFGHFFNCCDQVDDEGDNQFQKDKSNFFFRSGGMYISTAITYQTHIEAGQGRGR